MQPTLGISLIIQTYWSQITGAVFCVLLIGKLMATDSEQGKRLDDLEEKMDDMQPVWTQIRERLVRIETMLSIHFKDK